LPLYNAATTGTETTGMGSILPSQQYGLHHDYYTGHFPYALVCWLFSFAFHRFLSNELTASVLIYWLPSGKHLIYFSSLLTKVGNVLQY
jgi:hypothetical protein